MASYSSFHDDDLVDFLKSGDYQAFSEIYNRYWEKMAIYAIRITKSQEEGADIVQEMFVSIWNRRDVIDVKGNLPAYLIRGTKNLSLKYLEKNLRKNHFMDRLSVITDYLTIDVEQNLSVKELQDSIDAAVEKLPSKMKQVYILSRCDQLTHREIAEKLGLAQTTVKKQINNALKIIYTSVKPTVVVILSIVSSHFLREL